MIEEFGTSARPPARLGAIAGRWRTEGMVLGDEPVPVRGTDTYELLPGGFYLVHWVDVTVGDQAVRAIEIIGERVAGTDAVLARAYDDTGAMTVMQVNIGADGVWRFSGGAGIAPAARPDGRADDGAASDAGAAGDEAAAADEAAPGDSAVRSTLRVAPDGRSMTALWERADDGVTWEPWMEMRFALLQ